MTNLYSSIALSLILSASLALAKDHSAQYQVGVFSSNGSANDGSYSDCSGGSCSGFGASHNVHYVTTDDGTYSIEAPVSVAGTMIMGMGRSGHSPTMHKAWFMDQLHRGDKVLFAVKCDKHNRCEFKLPNPDKVDKEVSTAGFFEPAIAKTNTTSLCGKGKLNAAVEAQVCGTK